MKLRVNGVKAFLFGALVYTQFYTLAAFVISVKLISLMKSKPGNAMDQEQKIEKYKNHIIHRLTTQYPKRFPPEMIREYQNIKKSMDSKNKSLPMVENVYLSETGDELRVTMYPHGLDSKHIYFMKMQETGFEGLSLEGEESTNMRIFDGNNSLTAVFDAEFGPEKVSEGLRVFAKQGEVERAEWIRNQINKSEEQSSTG